jgi:hypothetical protein
VYRGAITSSSPRSRSGDPLTASDSPLHTDDDRFGPFLKIARLAAGIALAWWNI